MNCDLKASDNSALQRCDTIRRRGGVFSKTCWLFDEFNHTDSGGM